MAFPAIQKFTAAGQLLNQRITFVSLLATMGGFITGITNQAIAKGYTVAGSCNGVTGAMDGVNRCTTAAGFAVRATIAGAAQSWIVITAANGAQTLFAFQGVSDDIARISCSVGGLFVAAGTPANQPTATDEVVGVTAVSLIGATASSDRIFNVWIDSAHNGWRAAIFRLNILAAPLIWCELFDPTFVVSPASVPVPTWCGCLAPGSLVMAGITGQYSGNAVGGSTRMLISGTPTTVNMGASCKMLGNTPTAENGIAQTLNGSNFIIRSLGLSSVTATASGDVGNRFDFHVDQELKACGELDASKSWLYMNNNSVAGGTVGILWTWDGVSAWVGS